VLHVYADPSAGLRRALAEREPIRDNAAVTGIPRLYAAEETPAGVWVLEDRIPGSHPSARNTARWTPRVAEWLVGFAGPPGPALASTLFWELHHDAAVGAAGAGNQAAVARAFQRIAALPARHLHGDFQRRNIRIDGAAVGAVDWEGANRCGMPGLDLVFMALLGRSDRPDPVVVGALAAGTDPPFAPLLDALRRIGISTDLLPSALLAMLALWNVGEVRRIARGGSSPRTRPFSHLLAEWAARLDRR
jgi:hypothetical protein